jgi:flagellar hook-associated protein 2
MEKMKSTIKTYVGGSSSTFAQKAGLEKTASFTQNYYTEQLTKIADKISDLQDKYWDKEERYYEKFAAMESALNTLNTQMNYLLSM